MWENSRVPGENPHDQVNRLQLLARKSRQMYGGVASKELKPGTIQTSTALALSSIIILLILSVLVLNYY